MGQLDNRRRYTIKPKDWLKFTALQYSTTVTLNIPAIVRRTVFYSTDDGNTWTESTGTGSERTINVTLLSGKSVFWKTDGKGGLYFSSSNYGKFTKGRCKVSGNIMSMFWGDNLANTSVYDDMFYGLFYGNSEIVDASELKLPPTVAKAIYSKMFLDCYSLKYPPALPATTLAVNCYASMFVNCKMMETAPVLPATTLVQGCYYNMFNNCSKLKYIKALFTTAPTTTYTQNWVNGVASSGTYVKKNTAAYTTRGVNAIPNNWTIQTASS